MTKRMTIPVCVLAAGVLPLFLWAGAEQGEERRAAAVPVDDSMHHLMEYVFEPAYQRLRSAVADEPSDKPGWNAIKGDALTLAEVSNLLLERLPEDGDTGEWQRLAFHSRGAGGELYQAARAKDFTEVGAKYQQLLKSCNACHDAFADGEHQLEP